VIGETTAAVVSLGVWYGLSRPAECANNLASYSKSGPCSNRAPPEMNHQLIKIML